MKALKWLATVSLVALVGCSSAPYKADYDYRRDFDFTGLKTYSWMSPTLIRTSTQAANPLLENRLQESTKRALSARGFQYVEDPKQADFVLSFTVGARDKVKVTSYPEPYRGPYGWGSPYYGGYYGGGTNTDVRQYVEGTLAMDIFDVASKEPVYHAKASGVLKDRSQEERAQLLDQLMKDLTDGFPPGAESEK